MPIAATLRLEIERTLENRFPAALTPVPRTVCEVASTGIEEVDRLLDGGLPIGAISEITGARSSGRTSLVLCHLARRTRDGQVCAWVDVNDAFDPESAAANGVVLSQLLWVRCRNADKQKNGKPWARLDQALRATDLILQAAGFGAVVLDIGDTAQEYARRIPLATWFRFRQAAYRSRASLIVLGRNSYAQSSSEVVLECTARGEANAATTVLNGTRYEVQRHRRRFLHTPTEFRKPPVSAWIADVTWSGECCDER